MPVSPVSISVAGSAFSAFVDSVYPPMADQATYLNLFGGSDANAIKNIITGASGTKIGTLTHGTNYTNIQREIGIDTGVSFSSPFTYYAVCGRVPAGSASGQGIMGCFVQSVSADRQSLLCDSWNGTSGTPTLFMNYVTGQKYAPTSPGVGGTGFNFVYAQFDGATMLVGYGYADGSGNLQLISASGAYSYAPTTKTLRVGATGYGAAIGLNVPVAAAAAFPSVLTVEQLLAEYAFHRARMTALGLTLN